MLDACELSPSYVRAIAPYQPGKPISELAREMGLDEASIVKLASNENPLGTSALTRAAISAQLARAVALSGRQRFRPQAGPVRPLRMCVRSRSCWATAPTTCSSWSRARFLAAGTSSVFSQHAFVVYPLATQAAGATGIEVAGECLRPRPAGHGRRSARGHARGVDRQSRTTRPGPSLQREQVQALLARVPRRVIVVLDEAYHEYLPDALRVDTMRWLEQHPNLIITRTFSKAYGLAGLRVGFALAHPEICDLLNRVRQPFNVNSLAQAAAVAALRDQEFVQRSRRVNDEGMRQLTRGFERLRLDYIPSFGNFVTVRVGDAGAVYQRLLRQGVIVRPDRAPTACRSTCA